MENKIIVRKYEEKDLSAMIRIWNEVVEDGVAFPQEECLDEKTGAEFFAAQTYTAVAENMENGQVLGLYILHPEQCRPLRTHLQCKLRRIPRQPRTSYWRKAGKGLRSPGKSTWLPCTAV